MNQLFEIAGKISGPWSLAAFGLAAIVYIVLKKRGTVPALGWICILFLVVVPIISAAYVEVFRVKSKDTSVYRLRVTVLDSTRGPVEDAKVWSSLGGEPKKVPGGWEFDIPAALRPVNEVVTVFAAVPTAFLSAEGIVKLGADYNPTLIVRLKKNSPAALHGIVMDASGRGVPGATVTVVGGTSSANTQPDGQFTLTTQAADGEQVLLLAEKKGYKPVQQWHPAGNEPVTIIVFAK